MWAAQYVCQLCAAHLPWAHESRLQTVSRFVKSFQQSVARRLPSQGPCGSPRQFVCRDHSGVLDRAAVLQVCRDPGRPKLWQHVEEGSPASIARRFTIRSTSVRVIGFGVIFHCLSTLRKSSDFLSSRIPAASRYASRYASALWCAGTSCRLPPLGSLL